MRQLAATLIDPIRERLRATTGAGGGAPGDGAILTAEDLFAALVESARQWRGDRRLEVHRVPIPGSSRRRGCGWSVRTGTTSSSSRAPRSGTRRRYWVTSCGTCGSGRASPRSSGPTGLRPLESGHEHGAQPAAARSRFDDDPEKEAELFGIRVGQQMRALMERDVITGETARRIADALNYRGNRK
ncbi:hypothetical protein H4K36_03745 [Streptomyces sp. DHE7-1]|nr:hypothetical protein [Streptomyces sp. DHE7-1]